MVKMLFKSTFRLCKNPDENFSSCHNTFRILTKNSSHDQTVTCVPFQEEGELPARAQVSANTALLTIPNFDTDAAGRYTCTARQRNKNVRQRVIEITVLRKLYFVLYD